MKKVFSLSAMGFYLNERLVVGCNKGVPDSSTGNEVKLHFGCIFVSLVRRQINYYARVNIKFIVTIHLVIFTLPI